MSKHKAKFDFWRRFWVAMGTFAMFLGILLGSTIIGLAIAWTVLRGSWLAAGMVVAVCIALGIPTAVIVAKWPYWAADRQRRHNTIEFDFTGLKPGQETYYRALLKGVNPRNRKRLLQIQRGMEHVKATNLVQETS